MMRTLHVRHASLGGGHSRLRTLASVKIKNTELVAFRFTNNGVWAGSMQPTPSAGLHLAVSTGSLRHAVTVNEQISWSVPTIQELRPPVAQAFNLSIKLHSRNAYNTYKLVARAAVPQGHQPNR